MKKTNKIYIYMIVIYLIIALVLLIYFVNNNNNSGYLILPSGQVFYVENKKITPYLKNFDEMKKIKVIINSEIVELEFKIINQKAEIYRNEKEIEDDYLIAYSSNLNLKLSNYSIEELDIDDMKKVDEILQEHDIIGYENLNTNSKISFDYNNDGNLETIYLVSNLFDETKYDKVFSFAYYIDNGNIIYLLEQVDTIENTYDLCVPYVNSIIDLNHDDENELLLSCEYFSEIGTNTNIYSLKNGQFQSINK